MKRLLLLTIFFSFSKSDNVAEKKSDCHWRDGVNKTGLTKLNDLVGESFECVYEQYTYTINICGKDAQYVAVKQEEEHGKNPYKIGDMRSADLYSGNDWLMLWFYDGDPYHKHCEGQNRSAAIMIKCDSWAGKGIATALEENTDKAPGECHYLFEINSARVCPPKKGLSAGSIFVIIFTVVVAIYLIGGFLYQRCVARAQGWDQFPNRDFWINFGNLQADGCDFLCRCGSRLDSKEYRSIDDAIAAENQVTPRNEERDERLLSM